MRNTFKKEEKLKSRKLITELFNSGRSISAYPIKLIYLEMDHRSPFKIQAGVTVSKRNFKKAVDRNRIKRLLREAYRLNKPVIYDSENTKKHIFMFIYTGREEEKFEEIDKKMKILMQKFLNKTKPKNNLPK